MNIIRGLGRKCKDSYGGVSKVWLMPYQKYARKSLSTDDDYLIAFPGTIIYEFISIQNPVFSEQYNVTNEYFEQTLSLSFQNIDGKKLRYLKCGDYRIIVQDKKNNLHILGLYNGMEVTGVNYTTGANGSDFNGIKIDFTGKEENGSYLVSNLENVGFINNGTEETFYLLFQNETHFFLQNNNILNIENNE